jgi:hypothetical protein
MSAISSLILRSDLKSFATGAAQDALVTQSVANFLAPRCPVPTPLFSYMAYDKAKPFKIVDWRRSNGGRATQLDTGGTSTSGQLDSYALDYPVDKHVLTGSENNQIQFVRSKAQVTAQVGALSWAKEVVDAAATAAGAATDYNVSSATEDVINGIDGHILTVLKASMCGDMCPVRVLFGAGAWKLIKNHATVRGRFLANGGKKNTVPTDSEVGEMFISNPKIKVAFSSYNAAAEGATSTPTWLLDTNVYIFAAAETPTDADPSFMKTFHVGGELMQLGSYMRDDDRAEVLKCDMQAKVAVTNSAGVVRLNLTIA